MTGRFILPLLGLPAGLAGVAFACSAVTGCASDAPDGPLTSTSSYSGGMGYSVRNEPSRPSSLPGPDYYQSSDNPFHAD